ncbi:MAG: tRNA epoxyqueuosine(34) reductase QueG [Planctomycetota bacterium]|nr:MAG: tRNA epoxyqueuosine(34) reductase QueG [Planctomycetota bacterium]
MSDLVPSSSSTAHSPSDRSTLSAALKERAAAIGFELVGIAPAVRAGTWEKLDEWLARGFAGEMKYIERRKDAYQHPEHVLPQVRSVVMLGLVYGSDGASRRDQSMASGIPRTDHSQPAPRIARYAQGTLDYHDVIREKLKQLADSLHELQPGCRTRGVVDTAPLLERDYARLAGLGWFGKNTLLINRRMGSELFLAALLTDCELEPDAPHETQHCGSCTRCLDACPTGAFPAPYVLDATRCISYLTIELRNAPIPEPLRPGMGDWIFGCDVCQTVCPWNSKAPATQAPEFTPETTLTNRTLTEWLSLTPEEFAKQLGPTPLSRPGWPGIIRNACIAAGNSGDISYLDTLERLTSNTDPIVSDAARWAIEQITRAAQNQSPR